jgi:hypothetical protein
MTRPCLRRICPLEEGSVNHLLTPCSTSSRRVGPCPAKGRVATISAAIIVLLVGVFVGLLIAAAPNLYAADPPQLTAAKVKKMALDAIRTGAVRYQPAKNRIEGRTMLVDEASIPDEADADVQNPLVKIFYDQVELELLRKDLLQRQSSRQVMAPYYAKVEEIIGKKLTVAQDTKLNDDSRDDQLSKLDEQEQTTLSDGLTAVAKSIGLDGIQFQASSGLDVRDVKLVASKGATLDFVRQTTALLLHDAGKQDKDFPWTSYQPGETASLAGVYYCRVRLNGKEATLTKRVGAKTEELEFPDP